MNLRKIDLNDRSQVSVTSKQMARVDEVAINEFGINLLQMMELAGFGLASLCTLYLNKGGKVLILAGGGHNGGGGLVAAKHLHNWGYKVSIYLTSRQLKSSTQHQLRVIKKLGVATFTSKPTFPIFDLVIDSILGYNIKGTVKEPIRSLIEDINSKSLKAVSLDLPSGLNPDTGKPEGTAVKAKATLTL
ncbi:NAD(P)H-hydrate epimerase, partial [Patescibacteria group bacterium]|nr:NAD(P)H-hydrate epimerase [Patescibacteria group bacterium]